MPLSASAGCRVTETRAPVCRPVPTQPIGLRSVRWVRRAEAGLLRARFHHAFLPFIAGRSAPSRVSVAEFRALQGADLGAAKKASSSGLATRSGGLQSHFVTVCYN